MKLTLYPYCGIIACEDKEIKKKNRALLHRRHPLLHCLSWKVTIHCSIGEVRTLVDASPKARCYVGGHEQFEVYLATLCFFFPLSFSLYLLSNAFSQPLSFKEDDTLV